MTTALFDEIHHVAIIASNYQKSKNFYVNKLGFPIIHEVYREEKKSFKLDLKVGNQAIELFSFIDPPKRVTDPEATGLRHLCFKVKDLKATIAKLNSLNIDVEPIRVDPYTSKRFTFFQDPDFLPIEIYES
ncbi:SMU1112c/YaeR family gloxylase I-like metalloprotein [Lacticigenium naphthae]|uniref:SMU1112c/YaeR family gloxylase I-like metalloprotein n=1 Tax=Lacticigenium naphthae TaxID=515351 RepID=UPI00040F079F|nr:VOC family protein [Lacticigenium naphthae]